MRLLKTCLLVTVLLCLQHTLLAQARAQTNARAKGKTTAVKAASKEVTLTLVRWPYT